MKSTNLHRTTTSSGQPKVDFLRGTAQPTDVLPPPPPAPLPTVYQLLVGEGRASRSGSSEAVAAASSFACKRPASSTGFASPSALNTPSVLRAVTPTGDVVPFSCAAAYAQKGIFESQPFEAFSNSRRERDDSGRRVETPLSRAGSAGGLLRRQSGESNNAGPPGFSAPTGAAFSDVPPLAGLSGFHSRHSDSPNDAATTTLRAGAPPHPMSSSALQRQGSASERLGAGFAAAASPFTPASEATSTSVAQTDARRRSLVRLLKMSTSDIVSMGDLETTLSLVSEGRGADLASALASQQNKQSAASPLSIASPRGDGSLRLDAASSPTNRAGAGGVRPTLLLAAGSPRAIPSVGVGAPGSPRGLQRTNSSVSLLSPSTRPCANPSLPPLQRLAAQLALSRELFANHKNPNIAPSLPTALFVDCETILSSAVIPAFAELRDGAAAIERKLVQERAAATRKGEELRALQAAMRKLGIYPTFRGVVAPVGSVAIVCLEVCNVGDVWVRSAAAARGGLAVVDRVVRQCLSDLKGYEAINLGQSMLMVFPQAAPAINFCLNLQQQLLGAPWTEALLAHAECAQDSRLLWRGFKVRMAVHVGTTETTVDPGTQRTLYSGRTVGTAGALCRFAPPGTIAVSKIALGDLNPTRMSTHNGASIRDVGQQLFDEGEREVALLVPSALEDRFAAAGLPGLHQLQAAAGAGGVTSPTSISTAGAAMEGPDTVSGEGRVRRSGSVHQGMGDASTGGQQQQQQSHSLVGLYPPSLLVSTRPLDFQLPIYEEWEPCDVEVLFAELHAKRKAIAASMELLTEYHVARPPMRLNSAVPPSAGPRASLAVEATRHPGVGGRTPNTTNLLDIPLDRSGTDPVPSPRSLSPARSLRDDAHHQAPTMPDGAMRLIIAMRFDDPVGIFSHSAPLCVGAVHAMRACVRPSLRIAGGVELGVRGDAFLVCFEDRLDGLAWALRAQTSLLEHRWSQGLLLAPGCEPQYADGKLLFRGPRVRCGIHFGSVVYTASPEFRKEGPVSPPTLAVGQAAPASTGSGGGGVHGDIDRACALCNFAVGGETLCSGDVLQEGSSLDSLKEFAFVRSLGRRTLREPRLNTDVWQVWPTALSERAELSEAQHNRSFLVAEGSVWARLSPLCQAMEEQLPGVLRSIADMERALGLLDNERAPPDTPAPAATSDCVFLAVDALVDRNEWERASVPLLEALRTFKRLVRAQQQSRAQAARATFLEASERRKEQQQRGPLSSDSAPGSPNYLASPARLSSTVFEVASTHQSFLLCFTSALEAASFAVQLHERMCVAPWPPGLAELPSCRRTLSDDLLLYSGLRIRCGITRGPAFADLQSDARGTKGRTLLQGVALQRAARIAATARFGETLADEECTSLLTSDAQHTRTILSSVPRGTRFFPGDAAPMALHGISCPSLRGRLFSVLPTEVSPLAEWLIVRQVDEISYTMVGAERPTMLAVPTVSRRSSSESTPGSGGDSFGSGGRRGGVNIPVELRLCMGALLRSVAALIEEGGSVPRPGAGGLGSGLGIGAAATANAAASAAQALLELADRANDVVAANAFIGSPLGDFTMVSLERATAAAASAWVIPPPPTVAVPEGTDALAGTARRARGASVRRKSSGAREADHASLGGTMSGANHASATFASSPSATAAAAATTSGGSGLGASGGYDPARRGPLSSTQIASLHRLLGEVLQAERLFIAAQFEGADGGGGRSGPPMTSEEFVKRFVTATRKAALEESLEQTTVLGTVSSASFTTGGGGKRQTVEKEFAGYINNGGYEATAEDVARNPNRVLQSFVGQLARFHTSIARSKMLRRRSSAASPTAPHSATVNSGGPGAQDLWARLATALASPRRGSVLGTGETSGTAALAAVGMQSEDASAPRSPAVDVSKVSRLLSSRGSVSGKSRISSAVAFVDDAEAVVRPKSKSLPPRSPGAHASLSGSVTPGEPPEGASPGLEVHQALGSFVAFPDLEGTTPNA